MRVRSHSMETMGGSQKHGRSVGGGGVPTSLSGAGLTHSSPECNRNSVSTPRYHPLYQYAYRYFFLFAIYEFKAEVRNNRVIYDADSFNHYFNYYFSAPELEISEIFANIKNGHIIVVIIASTS